MTTNRELKESARSFKRYLDDLKQGLNDHIKPQVDWYPYSTLSNFDHLENLLGEQFNLRELMGKSVADIGGSDGDLSFFIETLGIQSDLVENASTQHNGLRGAKKLREKLQSKVNLIETNIDKYFELQANYDLVFFLGILYHLQNPYNAMMCLRNYSNYCLLSTRIARWAPSANDPGNRTFIGDLPVAYLLGASECNNDSTNYWIFSELGLKKLFERTGWEVLASQNFGDVRHSNPRDQDHDERFFCLLRATNKKHPRIESDKG